MIIKPLDKILKIQNMTIAFRSVFQKDGKYYPQFFQMNVLYELEMLEYDRIDISEGTGVNKTNASKECDICHLCILKILALNMNHIFAMVAMIFFFFIRT